MFKVNDKLKPKVYLCFLVCIMIVLIACKTDSNATTDPNSMDGQKPIRLALGNGFMYFSNETLGIDYFDIENQKSVSVVPANFCDGKPSVDNICSGNSSRLLFENGIFKDDSDRIYFFWESIGEEGSRVIELVRMDKDGQNITPYKTDITNLMDGVVQLKGSIYVIEVQESFEQTEVKRISLQGKTIEKIVFPGKVDRLNPDGNRLYFIQDDSMDLINHPIEFYDVKTKEFGKTDIQTVGVYKIKNGNWASVVRDETIDYTLKEAFSIVFYPREGASLILENNAGSVYLTDDRIITTHQYLVTLDEEEQRTVNVYDYSGVKCADFFIETDFVVKGFCCGHFLTYHNTNNQFKIYPIGDEP